MRNGERPKLNRNDYVFFTKKRIKKLLESKYTKRQSKVSALSLSLMTHWSKSSRYVAVGFEENHPEIHTHTHTGHTPRITFLFRTATKPSKEIRENMVEIILYLIKWNCQEKWTSSTSVILIESIQANTKRGEDAAEFPHYTTECTKKDKKSKRQVLSNAQAFFKAASFGFTHRDAQS